MKVNFKQPRYVLPLIVLPFLCLFFYVYRAGFAKKQDTMPSRSDSLQAQIAEVSDQVKNRALSDKLAAYREQYRHGDDDTAIDPLPEENTESFRFDELYNATEKQKLDSIARSIQTSSASLDSPLQDDQQEEAIQRALGALQQSPPHAEPPLVERADPMELFRQQMAYADSMARANDPHERAERQERERLQEAKREFASRPRLPVSKYTAGKEAFNTVMPDNETTFIQAIIDEHMTGYADSRLRIRLLDDLSVGAYVIEKGTHIFARISGFSGQRVLLTITSIVHDHHILPVRLEIYDRDGLPGLYVPESAFREFSQDLGGQTVQGINLQQQAETNSQLVSSAIQRMFQSTTTAVSRHIRKNKVKLKYNTMVYLIDPQTLGKNNPMIKHQHD